jgi:DNA repair exonuclease SbcCD ATPase subunit
MIKSAHLKNFRKHVDLEINFEMGLNTLRGPNEQGKTTIIEAIIYSLWGAKSLRDNLAETVTWGQKEAALWVKVVLSLEGIDYTFTRSKGGCECNYVKNGEALKVVGQSEVTNFSTVLMGADSKTAAALMMADQSGLRGALAEGPTAASGLMAKLANFDLIDKLVMAAQGNLVLGAEAPVREKLVAAQAELASVEIPSGTQADFYESMRASAQANLEAAQAAEPALAEAVSQAAAAVQQAERRNSERAQADREVQQINQRVENLFVELRAAKEIVGRRPDPGLVVQATKALADAQQHGPLVQAYNLVRALPKYPEVFWQGSKATFTADLLDLKSKLATEEQKVVASRSAMNAVEKRRMGSGKCPTCGAVNVSQEHIDAHNAKLKLEIDDHLAENQRAAAAVKAFKEDITAMEAVVKVAKPFEDALKLLVNKQFPILIDESDYPPRLTWEGEPPVAPDLKALQRTLDILTKAHSDADKAEGTATTLTSQIVAGQSELENALRNQRLLVPVDVTPLKEAHDNALTVHREHMATIGAGMLDVQEYIRQRDDVLRSVREAEIRKEAAKRRVEELTVELDSLIFNNALVAKLRNLKPKITDELWNRVLSAVSTFFSTLRGETSVVTKGSSGFKVNDRSVDSLSGSTLDVLAIAIRVAMTKTFIPQATFIILDEPAHGCDVARTGNVLGFLASVGFNQVILASHDELSEAVADRVIALGS